jgi:hypothetical protein
MAIGEVEGMNMMNRSRTFDWSSPGSALLHQRQVRAKAAILPSAKEAGHSGCHRGRRNLEPHLRYHSSNQGLRLPAIGVVMGEVAQEFEEEDRWVSWRARRWMDACAALREEIRDVQEDYVGTMTMQSSCPLDREGGGAVRRLLAAGLRGAFAVDRAALATAGQVA